MRHNKLIEHLTLESNCSTCREAGYEFEKYLKKYYEQKIEKEVLKQTNKTLIKALKSVCNTFNIDIKSVLKVAESEFDQLIRLGIVDENLDLTDEYK